MAENVLKIEVTEGGLSRGGTQNSQAKETGKAAGDAMGQVLKALGILQILEAIQDISTAMDGVLTVASIISKLLAAIVRPLVDLLIPPLLLLIFLLTPFVKLFNLLLRPLFNAMLIVAASLMKRLAPRMDQIFTILNKIAEFIGRILEAFFLGQEEGMQKGEHPLLAGLKKAGQLIFDELKLGEIKIGDSTISEWIEKIKTIVGNVMTFVNAVFGEEGGENNSILKFIKDPVTTLEKDVLPKFKQFIFSIFDEITAQTTKKFLDMKIQILDIFIELAKSIQDIINSLISAYNNSLGELPGVKKISRIDITSGLESIRAQSAAQLNGGAGLGGGRSWTVNIQGDVIGTPRADFMQRIMDQAENINNQSIFSVGV